MSVANRVKEALTLIKSSRVQSAVDEVWWFGSSSEQSATFSRDIDLALFSPSNRQLVRLEKTLRRLFPRSTIQHAGGYTKHRGTIQGATPLHFVLDTTTPTTKTAPIRRSILNGSCLWQRNAASRLLWNSQRKTFRRGIKTCSPAP